MGILEEQKKADVMAISLDGMFRLPIRGKITFLGRNAECGDYMRDKNYVAVRHAAVTIEDGKVYVEDLRPCNGTYINGVRMKPGTRECVSPSDVVGLGSNDVTQTGVAFLKFVIEGLDYE